MNKTKVTFVVKDRKDVPFIGWRVAMRIRKPFDRGLFVLCKRLRTDLDDARQLTRRVEMGDEELRLTSTDSTMTN